MGTMDIYEKAQAKILEIEAEMKAIGVWQNDPLPPEAYNITEAFGANSMSFEQWIQFILISRVTDVIKEKGSFPQGSSVGVYAMRVFNGASETAHLEQLLRDFDSLFN
jgi:uncharacterized protein YqcC (DUF446 family)